MEQSATTFWLAAPTDGGSELSSSIVSEVGGQQNKTGDLASVFNQPTVMNFATIFAGATAAVASSGETSLIPGQRVPSLSEIGISPARRTTLISINNFQSVPSLNHITPSAQHQISPASTVVVNTLNSITPLTTTVYTLPLPSNTIQISKNFIQQAAQASGLTSPPSTAVNPSPASEIRISSQSGENGATYVASVAPTPAIPQNSESSTAVQGISLQPPVAATYQCTVCNKTFENTGQLRYHTFVAHGELQARPHKCSACPESFLMEHHLMDHMRAIHLPADQGGGPPFQCTECMASFNDGGHLNFHLYMAHTIQGSKPAQQQFPCPECGKNFIKTSLRAAHIRNVHSGQVYAESALTPVDMTSVEEIKSHKCTECRKSFKTQSYLKQHIMSVHDKPLKCSVCERGFGRKSDLKRHMRGVHMKKRPHVCTKCGWTFSEVGNLKHHLQAVHQKEKNFRCVYCSKTFSLSSYLKTHLARIHNVSLENTKSSDTPEQTKQLHMAVPTVPAAPQSADATFTTTIATASNTIALQTLQISIAQAHLSRCYECGQTFQTAQMLQDHVMSSHLQPFWCTVCGEGFSLAIHLQLHLQFRHAPNDHQELPSTARVHSMEAIDLPTNGEIALEIREALPDAQPIVTQQLALASAQSLQQISVPPSNTVPATLPSSQAVSIPTSVNKCQICGLIYDTAPEKHTCWKKISSINTVTLNDMPMRDNRPHLCSQCGKGFKTTTHLKQHARCVHSKQKPHKCPQCEKCFARTSDMNRHVKGVHHGIKNARSAIFVTLKCSECGAIYAETSQLKRHIYTHHLQGRPSYKCADCQEGFTDETSFQSHICHEEERPNVCSVCSKRFQMVQQLRRHMRAAHGRQNDDNQVHKCFQCERMFGRSIDLERHIQAVHLKEKPHKCTLCGKSFGLQGNLNKHVRAVHLLEKPHQCIECGKRFAHVGVLKRHLRDIHFYDKKASVKQKLALIQIKNARALMCNIVNVQSNNVAETSQNPREHQSDEARQLQMKSTSQVDSIPPQPVAQTFARPSDLPLIETISRQQLQEPAMQTLPTVQQISSQEQSGGGQQQLDHA